MLTVRISMIDLLLLNTGYYDHGGIFTIEGRGYQ